MQTINAREATTGSRPRFNYVRKDGLRPYGIPLSIAAIYARGAAGTFPKPVKLGARAVAWRSDHLDAWMANPTGWRAAA